MLDFFEGAFFATVFFDACFFDAAFRFFGLASMACFFDESDLEVTFGGVADINSYSDSEIA